MSTQYDNRGASSDKMKKLPVPILEEIDMKGAIKSYISPGPWISPAGLVITSNRV